MATVQPADQRISEWTVCAWDQETLNRRELYLLEEKVGREYFLGDPDSESSGLKLGRIWALQKICILSRTRVYYAYDVC